MENQASKLRFQKGSKIQFKCKNGDYYTKTGHKITHFQSLVDVEKFERNGKSLILVVVWTKKIAILSDPGTYAADENSKVPP